MSDVATEFATSSLEEDMCMYDSVQSTISTKRDVLITKLEEHIDTAIQKLATGDDPDLVTAQTNIIKLYTQTLNEQENSAKRRVDTKLKKKEGDTSAKTAEFVSEFLRSRNTGKGGDVVLPPTSDSIAEDESRFDTLFSDITITEGELRTDPSDVS